MKKKAATVIAISLVCILIFCNTAYATSFGNTWTYSPQILTKNNGIKGFPYQVLVNETGSYSGNYLVLNYHLGETSFYWQRYQASELWYNVQIKADYKNGGSTVGSIGLFDWTKRILIIPPNLRVNGGENWNSFNLDRRYASCRAEYTTILGAPDFYAPHTQVSTLTF